MILGDPRWGSLILPEGTIGLSPVVTIPSGIHCFSVEADRYDTGQGAVDIYIRGSTIPFGNLDPTPTWELYIEPVNRNWTYAQVRVEPAIPTAWAWGEELPLLGEEPERWNMWTLNDGSAVTVRGDPDWGELVLLQGETAISRVVYLSAGTHYITINLDRYQTGDGSKVISIRGSVTAFSRLDPTPSWEVYTVPVNKVWTYIQIKIEST